MHISYLNTVAFSAYKYIKMSAIFTTAYTILIILPLL